MSVTELDPETLNRTVESLLDDLTASFEAADSNGILLLPDTWYPFHPSTGLVTNPIVVSAVAHALHQSYPDVDIGVGFAGSEYADWQTSTTLLGYDTHLEREEISVIDLTSAETVEQTVHLSEEIRTVNIPEPLLKRTVIAIPSLRYGNTHRLAGGMVTVARGVSNSPTSVNTAAAATAVDPSVTILDGTYTYTGQPHRSRFLVAGADLVTIDRLAADLLELSPASVPMFDSVPQAIPEVPNVDGLQLESIRTSLPTQEPPDSTEPGTLLSIGYELYTRVTGDAYPPQMGR